VHAGRTRVPAREPYVALTKIALSELAAKRDLPKTGTVDELVQRLVEADTKVVPGRWSHQPQSQSVPAAPSRSRGGALPGIPACSPGYRTVPGGVCRPLGQS
jgi:hypothetical protein